jgi:hypothetical protein
VKNVSRAMPGTPGRALFLDDPNRAGRREQAR